MQADESSSLSSSDLDFFGDDGFREVIGGDTLSRAERAELRSQRR